MAIYLITAGTTPVDSGLLETPDGLVLDFSKVAKHGYVTTIGDATNTSFTITHNLSTRDVAVYVYRAVSPYDKVDLIPLAATTNTVTLEFAYAPPTNEYRVVVQPAN